MSISKKIRFEVFKRDSFRCAYCGETPPKVILEVDHIDPKSKGGKDEINNLLTACFDCNRGKKDILLQVIPGQLKENLEILQEKENQILAYRRLTDKIRKRIGNDIWEICEIYTNQYPGWFFSDTFKNASIKNFLSKLPKQKVIDALYIAIGKYPKDKERVVPYFCGICWNKIRGI